MHDTMNVRSILSFGKSSSVNCYDVRSTLSLNVIRSYDVKSTLHFVVIR